MKVNYFKSKLRKTKIIEALANQGYQRKIMPIALQNAMIFQHSSNILQIFKVENIREPILKTRLTLNDPLEA